MACVCCFGEHSAFVSDVSSELTESGERGTFVISSVEIDHQEQIGNKSSKELHHQSVRTTRNEVIDVEMPFPPCEELLDFPSKPIDESDLQCSQILAIGGNPEDCATESDPYQSDGVSCAMLRISEIDFSVEEDVRVGRDREFSNDHLLGVFSNATGEESAFFLPAIKPSMILIPSIRRPGFPGLEQGGDKGTFCSFPVCQIEFPRNTSVEIEAEVHLRFLGLGGVVCPLHRQRSIDQTPINGTQLTQLFVLHA